jgi:hypothetical protein
MIVAVLAFMLVLVVFRYWCVVWMQVLVVTILVSLALTGGAGEDGGPRFRYLSKAVAVGSLCVSKVAQSWVGGKRTAYLER